MVIKGDGSLLTIALRGIYAQGRVGQYHADRGYAFSVNKQSLENVEFVISVVEAFDLGTTIGTEVHKDSYRVLSCSQITKRLIVLLL